MERPSLHLDQGWRMVRSRDVDASTPKRFRSRLAGRVGVVVLGLLGAGALSACGGGGAPSAETASRTVVASFTSSGVEAPQAERDCVIGKAKGQLSGQDREAKKLTDLSQAARVLVAQDIESCFSDASMKQVFDKAVGGQIGLAPPAAACLANAVAAKVKYTALVKQERAAVDAVAKAARKCASAR